MRLFPLISILPWIGLSACTQIDNANGSFEESEVSGRIQVDGVDSRRFFRFHLRQFSHEIGGTFESFDLSNYTMFSQVPLYMTSATNFYYCARIDHGYVRGNTIHVTFTDREQRQWIFSADLGGSSLSGSLVRMNHAREGESYLMDSDSLMPEDAAYYSQNSPSGTRQIVLDPMDRDTKDSLECIYYFRRFDVNFVLPPDFPLDQCDPSPGQCHNYRLAIIGTRPQKLITDVRTLFYTEVQSAYLDQCDIQPGMVRSMVLRDNPFLITGMRPGIFIATAIIYEDVNRDGYWDLSNEPVLAALKDNSIVFYEEPPESAIYGNDPSGKTYQVPVLTPGNTHNEPGWHIYTDNSDVPDKDSYLRILNSLVASDDNVLVLEPTTEDFRGCQVMAANGDLPSCRGLLPLLIQ